jgi:hypothetical protein
MWLIGIYILIILLIWFIRISDPYHIVVARYNEDPYSWLPKDDKYIKVYNKGLCDNITWSKLPNIGREAHTYLTYIVENYYALPLVVFFTQGSNDHIDGHTLEYFTCIKSDVSQNYGTFDIRTGLDENLHIRKYGNEYLYPELLDFKSWVKDNFDIELYNEINFYKGATFSVKRERILSRPLEFYKKLLSLIPEHPSPEIAHYFERVWWYIFN